MFPANIVPSPRGTTMSECEVSIHPTAIVNDSASIGEKCVIWSWAHLRESCEIGSETTIGQGVYVGPKVKIGSRCKIQNGALIYEPAIIENSVFIGPAVVLTNDKSPRAVNLDGSPKNSSDWEPVGVIIREGASLGARVVVVAPVEIGAWAMVGAGSLVTKDVKPFAIIMGVPGRQVGWVGKAGVRLAEEEGTWVCPLSGERYREKSGQLHLEGNQTGPGCLNPDE